MVRIILSEVICKILVTISNSQGVRRFGGKPPKVLAKMLSKCKKIVYSLTLFGVRYKRIVTLATFTVSLQLTL